MAKMTKKTANNLQKRALRAKLVEDIDKLRGDEMKEQKPAKKAELRAKRGALELQLSQTRVRKRSARK
jgi:hypothetical protein